MSDVDVEKLIEDVEDAVEVLRDGDLYAQVAAKAILAQEGEAVSNTPLSDRIRRITWEHSTLADEVAVLERELAELRGMAGEIVRARDALARENEALRAIIAEKDDTAASLALEDPAIAYAKATIKRLEKP